MKLIAILFPSLMTIVGLSLVPLRAIGATIQSPPFTVTQTSDSAKLKAALFGDAPPLKIDTPFNLGQIPGGIGQFQNGGFLGLGQGLVMSTGSIEQCVAAGKLDPNCEKLGTVRVPVLSGVNCADGVNPSQLNANCLGRLQLSQPFVSGKALPRGTDLNSDFLIIEPVTGKVLKNPFDRIELDFLFTADQPGNLIFKYVFGSEEFPEFVPKKDSLADSDVFRVRLVDSYNQEFKTSKNVATAFNADPTTYIVNPIDVNRIGSNTPLDAYTQPIDVILPFTAGQNHLFFSIEDVGDEAYDSAVFIQQFSVQLNPPPSVPTPSLLFGFTWMGWRRWRDRHKRL
jgi:hypothetical protein